MHRRTYHRRNKHYKRPHPDDNIQAGFFPSEKFYQKPIKSRVKGQREDYPREFYDIFYNKSPKKNIYENIYYAMKPPSRIDEIYRTVLAAERIPQQYIGSDESKESHYIHQLSHQLKREEEKFEDQYKDRKRFELINKSLLDKYQGSGILYGGSAVDFPISDKINPKKINEYEKVSLSNKDIEKLVNGQTNVFTYPQLSNYKHIDEILDPYDSCVILYMTKKNYGHWCCLTKNNDRISFFDPYGEDNLPDEQLKNIPEHFREDSNQEFPHLTYLLYASGYPIEYNNYQFQKHQKDTNTCGRHCVNRLRNRHLNIDQYYNMMNSEAKRLGVDYDQLVTMLTSS